MKLNFVKTRFYFFAFSAILMLSSIILLLIPPALVPGIDFSSGTTMLISSENRFRQSELRELFNDLNHPEARIQTSINDGGFQYLIRTKELQVPQDAFTYSGSATNQNKSISAPQKIEKLGSLVAGGTDDTKEIVFLRGLLKPDEQSLLQPACDYQLGIIEFEIPRNTVLDVVLEPDKVMCGAQISNQTYTVLYEDKLVFLLAIDGRDYSGIKQLQVISSGLGERSTIEQAIYDQFGDFQLLEFSSVSPIVSNIAVRNASIAVIIATFFIMAYIAYAFSEMPKPFRYAIAAIVALVHDIVIVIGIFSILGKLWDFEVNLMVITALLTILGFSVHDSIVVFDRIRENINRNPLNDFKDNVNTALIETLARSLNTSITLILTIMTLLFIGGATIREFLVTMLVGVIIGTYSSIAIAAQFLVSWEAGDFDKLSQKFQFRKTN
jgi:preprotein translocase subunit SecF